MRRSFKRLSHICGDSDPDCNSPITLWWRWTLCADLRSSVKRYAYSSDVGSLYVDCLMSFWTFESDCEMKTCYALQLLLAASSRCRILASVADYNPVVLFPARSWDLVLSCCRQARFWIQQTLTVLSLKLSRASLVDRSFSWPIMFLIWK